MPQNPHPKQAAFLLLDGLEAFYGGAGGGGKSSALLMAALQYVDVPGYSALLLRKTFADLDKPGALMNRAYEWMADTDARWDANKKRWTFPSGAMLSFGYIQHPKDMMQYRGAEYQFIGFDELTQFTEQEYRFLFTRNRRLKGVNIPIRVRSASNPGDVGHEWVKRRFILEGRQAGRVFIPARIEDNPSLDREEYIRALQEVDPLTRAQILIGDWDTLPEGERFKRQWFKIAHNAPARMRTVRYWDLAATISQTSAYTAGVKMGFLDGEFYVLDVIRERCTPDGVEKLVRQTAELDGRSVPVWIEQEPGSGGINTITHYRRRVLPGWSCSGNKVSANKVTRSAPWASAAEAGNVYLIPGSWNITDYLDEHVSFPLGAFKDQVDASSGAQEVLTRSPGIRTWTIGDDEPEEEIA